MRNTIFVCAGANDIFLDELGFMGNDDEHEARHTGGGGI
jgi:hypothetical protein